MNFKSSLGFGIIFLLIMWAMTNQTVNEQTKKDKEAIEQQQKELAKKDSGKENLKLAPVKKNGLSLGNPLELAPATKTASKVDSAKSVIKDTSAIVNDDTVDSTTVVSRIIPHKKFAIETNKFIVTLDNSGAKVSSIIMKNLSSKEGVFPELILDKEAGALSLKLDDADFSNILFDFDTTTTANIKVNDEYEFVFTWNDDEGRIVKRIYTFTADSDEFSHKTIIENFNPKLYTIEWNGGLKETEEFLDGKGWGLSRYYYSEVVLDNIYEVLREMPKERTFYNEKNGKSAWVGLRRKYVAGLIKFDKPSEASIEAMPLDLKTTEVDPGTYKLIISDRLDSDTISFDFSVLPLEYTKIVAEDQNYEKILFSGWQAIGADVWFVGLCGLIVKLLGLFYNLIPNYGIAIILLTLLIKLITLPLTLKQQKGAQTMQKHKPAMDAIKVKYRSDPTKMNKEMMAYYQKAGINPMAQMAGCFPMLLQFPIFISLFLVLGRVMELRFAPFFGWIDNLAMPEVITTAFHIPYIMPFGISILPFVMVITTYFQTKQTIVDPNQKMMIYIMPGMMFLFSNIMPSGLLVYWIISNIFSIAVYKWIKKDSTNIDSAITVGGTGVAIPKNSKKKKKNS